MKKKSIALVGGGGFIGTNLSDFFIKKGYNVLVIGRSLIESHGNDSLYLRTKLIDVNKTSILVNELFEYENIVWLVNGLVPSSSMDSLIDDFAFNTAPLINFLENANSLHNLKRFIFISSGGTIYGNSHDGKNFDEDSIKKPVSAYGLSKLISEDYVKFLTRKSTFQSFILRPSNVYGNHQNFKKPQGIIGYAFNAALNGTSIDVYGGGEVVRDFVHVLDLAEALNQCILSDFVKAEVEIYNIGSEEGYTIKKILALINEISGANTQYVYKPNRSFDCNYNVLNIQKIRNNLGWYPKIEIKDGLRSLWEWINFNQNKNL